MRDIATNVSNNTVTSSSMTISQRPCNQCIKTTGKSYLKRTLYTVPTLAMALFLNACQSPPSSVHSAQTPTSTPTIVNTQSNQQTRQIDLSQDTATQPATLPEERRTNPPRPNTVIIDPPTRTTEPFPPVNEPATVTDIKPTIIIDTSPTIPNNHVEGIDSVDSGVDATKNNRPNISTATPAGRTAPVNPTDANNSSSNSSVIILPEPDRRTPQEILLERARSNSQITRSTSTPTLENGDDVPAFRRLMQTGIAQLQSGDLNAADDTFTRAQRLAPQSSAVYFYLGQVAIKRNQPRRAEAMARRGLPVAQTNARRRGLWQVILLAGQLQQSPRVINEAQTALAGL